MSAVDVEIAIREVMQNLDQAGHLVDRNVMTLRYAFIDPILLALGWSAALPWECQPNYQLAKRGSVDYALFDGNGYPAVLIALAASASPRRRDRLSLWQRVRGMTHGMAVLTSGWQWEIYDLSVRARSFDQRRVQRLVLDPSGDDNLQVAAAGLHHWLAHEHWR